MKFIEMVKIGRTTLVSLGGIIGVSILNIINKICGTLKKCVTNLNLRSIILLFIYIISTCLLTYFLPFYRNNRTLSTALFSSIVTISVLSMTIVAVVIQTNNSFYGNPFKNYSKYKNTAVSFVFLLILSFINIGLSAIFLIFDNQIGLTLSILYTIILQTSYSVAYFRLIDSEKKIKSLLLESNTIKNHGDEIIKNTMTYFKQNIDLLSSNETDLLFGFLKQVKNIYSSSDFFNHGSIRETFAFLSNRYSIIFAFDNFIHKLSDQDDSPVSYNDYLQDEFRNIKHYSYEVFEKRDYPQTIRHILNSQNIPLLERYTISHRIIGNIALNKNITPYIYYVVRDLLFSFIHGGYTSEDIKTTLATYFRKIYMDLVCFMEDEEIASSINDAITYSILNGTHYFRNDVNVEVLTSYIIMSWIYTKHDNMLNTLSKERILNYFHNNLSDNLSNIKYSISSLVFSHLEHIVLNMSKKYVLAMASNNILEFATTFRRGPSNKAFRESAILDFQFFLIMIRSMKTDNAKKMFSLEEHDANYQTTILERFINLFDYDTVNLNYKHDTIEKLTEVADFLECAYTIVPYVHVVKLYHDSIKELKELRTHNYELASTNNRGSVPKIFDIDLNNYLFLANTSLEQDSNHDTLIWSVTTDIAFKLSEDFWKDQIRYYALKIVNEIFDSYFTVRTFSNKKELESELNDIIQSKFLNVSNHTKLDNLLKKFEIDISLKDFFSFDTSNKTGKRLIFTNPDIFKVKFLNPQGESRKLTNDEIIDKLQKDHNQGHNKYLIDNIYYPYDEAFNIIKSKFEMTIITFDYLYSFNNQEEQPLGIILDIAEEKINN